MNIIADFVNTITSDPYLELIFWFALGTAAISFSGWLVGTPFPWAFEVVAWVSLVCTIFPRLGPRGARKG
jgi:hypothetical protein